MTSLTGFLINTISYKNQNFSSKKKIVIITTVEFFNLLVVNVGFLLGNLDFHLAFFFVSRFRGFCLLSILVILDIHFLRLLLFRFLFRIFFSWLFTIFVSIFWLFGSSGGDSMSLLPLSLFLLILVLFLGLILLLLRLLSLIVRCFLLNLFLSRLSFLRMMALFFLTGFSLLAGHFTPFFWLRFLNYIVFYLVFVLVGKRCNSKFNLTKRYKLDRVASVDNRPPLV